MGEHIDWALLRPEMAGGMGKLSAAVYGNSQLSVREREAARWTIALINDCAVCRDTRARDCPVPGHPCLSSVAPEEVVSAVRRLYPLLGRTGTGRTGRTNDT